MTQLIGSDPGYPYLKCKAAATRHMADFGLLLALRHQHGGISHGRELPLLLFGQGHHLFERRQQHLDLVVQLFQAMVDFHNSCSAKPFIEDVCSTAILIFLETMRSLHDLWRETLSDERKKKQPWHLRQKAHALQHLALDKLQIFGSPSQYWCYKDEDFMGSVKTIAAKSKHASTIDQRVSEKLMLQVGLQALKPM